jgi:hypothetical protein
MARKVTPTPAPTPATPTPAPSAKQLLGQLGGTRVKKSTATAQSSNPEKMVPEHLRPTFVLYMDAYALSEKVEDRCVNAADELKVEFFKLWTADLWREKSRPGNPRFFVNNQAGRRDHACIFQVQDSFKLNLAKLTSEDDPATKVERLNKALVDTFLSVDMSNEDAESLAATLIEKEIEAADKRSIDLSRLIDGHWEGSGKNRTKVEPSVEEQELATRIITLLTSDRDDMARLSQREFRDAILPLLLTPEEKDVVVSIEEGITVRKGFLGRVFTYVKSHEELAAVLSVIEPKVSISTQEYAIPDTEGGRNVRKLAAAQEMFATGTGSE